MQDKGGRTQWSQYSLAATSSSSSGSSSQPAQPSVSAATAARPSSSSHATKAPSRTSSLAHKQPTYQGGYVPARSPSPVTPAAAVAPVHARQSPPQQQQQQQPLRRQSLSLRQDSSPSVASYQQEQPATPIVTSASPTSPSPSSTAVSSASALYGTGAAPSSAIVTRVRALHTFEPTEPGELAFEKGDIIRVVDRGYKDWWRGQLKGRTGIFPVNYVVRVQSSPVLP